MQLPNDHELMIAVREGEVQKLRFLFERYQVPLYNYFLRLTSNQVLAEDFVQDVFMRILKYKHTYRGDGTFKGWLFNLARNVCMDHFRKKKWEFSGVDDHLDFLIDTEAEDSLEQTLRAENIQSALDTLSLEYREVLILSRYHDLKYEEIATMLGCTVGNVKIRVHRAIKALRKAFLSIEQ